MSKRAPSTKPQPHAGRLDPCPTPPVQPALEDCCRSGCTPCVFDLYDDAMDRYRTALAAWRARHPDAA